MFHRKQGWRGLPKLVALLAITAVGLAACGSGADEPEQDPDAALEVWIRKPPGAPTEETAKELAAAFTEQTGIPTEVTALFDDFETKLQQAASAKDLPDIVINDTAQLGTLVEQGLVREVDRDGIEGADDLTPASWDAATGADGAYYAVPFSAQSFALFIRSDWREAVGAEVPTTWGEMDALAEAFTTGDPDGNGEDDTHGYAVPGSTKRGYTSWYLSSFLWSGGGGFLDGEPGAFNPAVDSPESVEVLEWFQHTFCDGLVAPGAVTAETSQTHPVFYGGQAGIYFTGPYMMGVFDADLGAEKYEIVPLPAGEGGEAVSLAEGENVYLMAGSENQEGQERFAEFAASVEGQTIGMAGDTDGTIVRLPVNATVDMAEVRTDERWQTFQQIYQESGRYVPNVPEWTPFRQMAAETFNTVASDCEADPAAELGGLADEFAEELAGQGAAG